MVLDEVQQVPELFASLKAAATVTESDFRGLRKLRDASGSRFVGGVVLYDGESMARFGENLFAVPIKALWSMK
ncbi:hypothetical protein [Acidithiobacillus sp. IBUN Pt1247-S3]|uniref:hypothetical protein n=1 Tax=Acidithiobacillus sp. IBUN Pt1247-S3 TaxID=3166642 RepID=UPI0034E4B3E2